MDALKMDRKFTARSLNEGFSGGEKKRWKYFKWPCSIPSIA